MKISKWQLFTALSFVILSSLLYTIHYSIFHDATHLIYYFISDLAFVFIQVLLVTFILENHLEKREKKKRLEKLNMVIGLFFSELGTDLLKLLASEDSQPYKLENELHVNNTWKRDQFKKVKKRLESHTFELNFEQKHFESTLKLMKSKEDFLLRLLENPTLMEHESFTDLLHASFHLLEELKLRPQLNDLPQSDIKHLRGDCQRVYTSIIFEWINYIQYLESNYPYLFSLAIRTNPFLKNSSVIVNE